MVKSAEGVRWDVMFKEGTGMFKEGTGVNGGSRSITSEISRPDGDTSLHHVPINIAGLAARRLKQSRCENTKLGGS